MFEKVNPDHPDKLADRIAGAMVDLAYKSEENPRIAVEVLLGHGEALIISESSVYIDGEEVREIVKRIAPGIDRITYSQNRQDPILSHNQEGTVRCGDNGIFKGVPTTLEQRKLARIAKDIWNEYKSDGKYILEAKSDRLIICQSNAATEKIKEKYPLAEVNPIGDWTGGPDVDSGATNRKLGSDMGDAVTGGGLHGKDLSKADVSVNIYCHIKAQMTGKAHQTLCAIGDERIDGIPYKEIVELAREYVQKIGGFEKLAEWGLIR